MSKKEIKDGYGYTYEKESAPSDYSEEETDDNQFSPYSIYNDQKVDVKNESKEEEEGEE